MALDPNIALGVRVAPFETRIQSPVDRYARMLSLRQLMQQQETSQALEEERKQKAQLAREEQERQAQFRALWKPGEPEPTEQQAYSILGQTGGAAYAKTRREAETAQQAQEKARLENEKLRDTHLGQIAGGVLKENSQEGFERGIMNAGARDLISQEELHQLIGLRWDDPQTKAQVAQIARRGIEVQTQQAMDINAAGETRAAAIAKPTLVKAETEAVTAQAQLDANRLAAAITRSPEEFQTELAKLPPERAAVFQGATDAMDVYKRALTPQQRVTSEQAAAIGARTEAHQKEQERIARAQLNIAQQGLQLRMDSARTTGNDNALADVVMENPSVLNRLTPTEQGKILPILHARGFTQFGKPLNQGAMDKIAESKSAMASLKDLRQTLQDNEDYIGPIAGLQALNPYSGARQAQAKIDLVKQRVGKALEGGVLRKEDEEKYKRILATLRDTPETAIAKVDNLITTLERDIETYENEQRRGGRNVPEREPEKKTGGSTTKINTKEEYDKLPSGAQYVDAQDGKTYTKR